MNEIVGVFEYALRTDSNHDDGATIATHVSLASDKQFERLERSAAIERLELLELLEPPGVPINCCLPPVAYFSESRVIELRP